MKKDFLESRLFTPWSDPVSGVTSYVLTQRVAPVQQSFYYVNQSLNSDCTQYWFYCAFPPSGNANSGRCLGMADLEGGNLSYFPDTQFTMASPLLDSETGDVYWANESGVWKRSFEEDPTLVGRFPDSVTRKRKVSRYATHLSLSANRQALGIDGTIGEDNVVGSLLLENGDIEIWQTLEPNWNHGCFHPKDPDLMLLAQDYRQDAKTGSLKRYENRLWTIRRGGVPQAVYPDAVDEEYSTTASYSHLDEVPVEVTDRRSMHGHEWWSAEGRRIWYVHYKQGVECVDLDGRQCRLVWPHQTVSHAHSDTQDRWLVMDSLPPDSPLDHKVTFANLQNGRSIDIVSLMDQVPPELKKYHVHPHPQFCGNDQYICYTTLVMGKVDVAFVRVADLLEKTSD
ncbi:hypothetical protein [Puniceicoccus vermicola]|nr:hypothetical protein [Puniceicoccus vermicola]